MNGVTLSKAEQDEIIKFATTSWIGELRCASAGPESVDKGRSVPSSVESFAWRTQRIGDATPYALLRENMILERGGRAHSCGSTGRLGERGTIALRASCGYRRRTRTRGPGIAHNKFFEASSPAAGHRQESLLVRGDQALHSSHTERKRYRDRVKMINAWQRLTIVAIPFHLCITPCLAVFYMHCTGRRGRMVNRQSGGIAELGTPPTSALCAPGHAWTAEWPSGRQRCG